MMYFEAMNYVAETSANYIHGNQQAQAVLAKALLNAREKLGLNQQELGDIVGLHRSGITRLQQSMQLKPESKTGELALLLLRAYRSLYALFGGDHSSMQHFLRSHNHHTGGVPVEQMTQVQGLVLVVQYLDAIRGRA